MSLTRVDTGEAVVEAAYEATRLEHEFENRSWSILSPRDKRFLISFFENARKEVEKLKEDPTKFSFSGTPSETPVPDDWVNPDLPPETKENMIQYVHQWSD